MVGQADLESGIRHQQRVDMSRSGDLMDVIDQIGFVLKMASIDGVHILDCYAPELTGDHELPLCRTNKQRPGDLREGTASLFSSKGVLLLMRRLPLTFEVLPNIHPQQQRRNSQTIRTRNPCSR